MFRARTGPLAILTLAAGLLAACADEARPAPPLNALLVTLDTTRADALSCYGVHAGTTPHLDALAAEGVLYERASTVAPLTLPAHASILTGLVPLRHGVRDNGLWPLPESARTLAERAAEAGCETAAFVAAVVLDESFGLAQGFERYDAPEPPSEQRTSHYAERDARAVIDAALAWYAARDRSRPFLAWVHLFDPHSPYAPPEAFRRGSAPDELYRGEVAWADHELGRLLDALRADGTLARTLVLVAGDHGEAFGEHGEVSHGPFCYEPTLRVPFLVRDPGEARPGRRSRELVSVADVAPTLAEALGLAPEPGLDGVSLFRRAVPESRGVYFESYTGYLSLGWSPLAGWRDARGKYLHSSEPLLFDPVADPGEERDLLAAGRADPKPYRLALAEVSHAPRLAAEEAGASAEMLADLRGLGYAGVDAPGHALPDPLAPSDRPSPQSKAREHYETLAALQRFNAGDVAGAQPILARIAAQNPRNVFVLDMLGYALMRLGRHEEALEPLEALLRERPERANSWANLGISLVEVGRAEEAEQALGRALELDPGHGAALRTLDRLLEEAGRGAEADALRARAAAGSGR